MGRIFVIGDIHGANKALIQCLERSGFNYDEDTLIQLGDIADGWSEVYECIEELFKIRYLISIRGNHDKWLLDFLYTDDHPTFWAQGGEGTLRSYVRAINKGNYIKEQPGAHFLTDLTSDDIPPLHRKFFEDQLSYYVDTKNRLFIHGGFNRHLSLADQPNYIYWWDRDLWFQALSFSAMVRGDVNENSQFKNKDGFEEIFIGHTTTENWGTNQPMHAANIWNLDTGAGWSGKLTIMDVDTKEFWQSDLVTELYPNELGRRGK